MSKASFEGVFKIPLYMRRARAGSIIFSFFNEDDTDYNEFDDGRELHFYIRSNSSTTPLVDLTESNGLTVSGNDITPTLTVLQSTLAPNLYWWELYDNTNKKTLGIDRLQIGTREPAQVEQSVEVSLSSTTVRVTMVSGGTASQNRGGWDASGNAFPTTGGSGGGGAIVRGDRFYISNSGGGTLASAGEVAIPWPQYSIAEYLGSNVWRLY
jgi:hypothetical protein